MRFTAEQRFRLPAEDVVARYIDADFYKRLDSLTKIGAPHVLESSRAGDRVTVRIRYHFIADLPGAALAVIDPRKLTWIDETIYDLTTGTSHTRLLPDHYANRFSATATATFARDPSDDSRSIRRINGELRVRMPLVGGKVEEAIVSGLREHLDEEARILNAS